MLKPKNEIETIILFTLQAERYGFEILEAQSIGFPDALIKKDGKEYRVEFEYKSLNFRTHKHDPTGCDLIICWIDDDKYSTLPVVALSEDNWWNIPLIPDKAETIDYWKDRALEAERRNAKFNVASIDMPTIKQTL